MGEDYVHAKVTPRFSEILSLEAQNQTFQNASDMIRRLFHVEISTNTIRKVAENIGNKLHEEDEILEITHDQVNAEIAKDRGYVQIDGAMINHRDDSWKENKLAIFFFFKNIVRSGKELNERITIKKKQLVSSFAQGLEPFSVRFHKYLIKSKIFQAREIVIISDGATWISNIVEKFLPKCTHILDWFHTKMASNAYLAFDVPLLASPTVCVRRVVALPLPLGGFGQKTLGLCKIIVWRKSF